MNERTLKFRIYSFADRLWHYFDIYEGYPQGIYGAVTPPQQFTGMIDKNGKEIYEGDILEFHYFGFDGNETDNLERGEIFYSNVFSCFYIKTDAGNFTIEETSHLDEPCLGIIGNIIENKELLKDE